MGARAPWDAVAIFDAGPITAARLDCEVIDIESYDPGRTIPHRLDRVGNHRLRCGLYIWRSRGPRLNTASGAS